MNPRRATGALLLLSFFAFISLGLPDVILGVAWPSIRHSFELPISRLGWLLLTGMIGYLTSSFLGGWLTHHLGVGKLLLFSSLTITSALVGYSIAPAWWVMVGIGILSGLGAGAIDAGINAYAARHFSPRVVNWLHACWGIGATAGPMLMTLVLIRGASWRLGYAILAGILALMTVGFALTTRLWNDHDAGGDAPAQGPALPQVSLQLALRQPMVWAQIALFFLYTGVEAAVGQWMFSLLTESRGVSTRTAGFAVASYWAGLTAGRVLFGFLAAEISPLLLLRIALLAAPCCAATIWLGGSIHLTLAAIMLLGLALAPIYPLMISLTPLRVGKLFAAHSIGFQVSSASLGATAIPALAGLLAARVGLEAIPPYLLIVSAATWLIFEATNVRQPHLT